jgi:hypothetical protein
MIPKGAEAIGHLVTRVAQDLLPKASDAYAAADLGYLAVLLGMVAQDYDRAAEVLVSEHAKLLPILREAGSRLSDAGLKARIGHALQLEAPSLRVADLAARADVIMKLLIDVHAAVEEAEAAGVDWARALNEDIWRFLEEHVAAHAYDAPF